MKQASLIITLWLTLFILMPVQAKNIYFINATPFSVILDAQYVDTPSFNPCHALTDQTIFPGQIIKKEIPTKCAISFIDATLLRPNKSNIDIKKGGFNDVHQGVFIIGENKGDTHFQIQGPFFAHHQKGTIFLTNTTNFPLDFVVEYHNCTKDEGNLPSGHTKELTIESCRVKKVFGIVNMGNGRHKKTELFEGNSHQGVFVFKRIPRTKNQFKVTGVLAD